MAKISTVALLSKTGFSFSSFVKSDWLSEEFNSQSYSGSGSGAKFHSVYTYGSTDADITLRLEGTLKSDFSSDLRDLVSGRLTDFSYAVDGKTLFSVEDTSVSWSVVKAAYVSGDTNRLVNAILAGDDTVKGTTRADVLWGRGGDDKLSGYSGADILAGGTGEDRLDGGKGADILTGGAGSDTFVLKAGYGRDTVTDFTVSGSGHDIVDLSTFDVDSFSELKSDHFSKRGSDVVITFGSDSLVLEDTTIASLKASHFDL